VKRNDHLFCAVVKGDREATENIYRIASVNYIALFQYGTNQLSTFDFALYVVILFFGIMYFSHQKNKQMK